jgi:hypothetical protein
VSGWSPKLNTLYRSFADNDVYVEVNADINGGLYPAAFKFYWDLNEDQCKVDEALFCKVYVLPERYVCEGKFGKIPDNLLEDSFVFKTQAQSIKAEKILSKGIKYTVTLLNVDKGTLETFYRWLNQKGGSNEQ